MVSREKEGEVAFEKDDINESEKSSVMASAALVTAVFRWCAVMVQTEKEHESEVRFR